MHGERYTWPSGLVARQRQRQRCCQRQQWPVAGGVGFGSAKVSAGFRFDGVNDVVQVAANPSLDVGQGNGLALEFWINSTDVTRFTRVVGWHYGMGSGATNFGVN